MESNGAYGGKRMLALVVDDNQISLMAAQAVLCSCGVDTVLAESGVQAVTLAQDSRFDLVLVDHRMPGIDGEETASRIRALGGWCTRVPIIGLSAESEGGVLPGMDERLTKPLDASALRGALARCATGMYRAKADETTPGPPPAQEEWEQIQRFCPDLDVYAARRRMGGAFSAYRNVLRAFCRGVSESAAALERFAQAEDWDALRIAVHAQRGGLYSIDAVGPAGLAAELESCLHEREYAAVLRNLPVLTERLRTLAEQLAPLWCDGAAEAAAKPVATPGQRQLVPGHVAHILSLLARLEREEAMLEAKTLIGCRYGAAVDGWLADALRKIENFDYDGATVLLQMAGDAVTEG